MEHVHSTSVRSDFPEVRRVDARRPWTWLAAGFVDLKRVPTASLFYGLVIATVGALVLTLSWNAAHLVPALVGGFLLVAPFFAIGLYDISRQAEGGGAVDGGASFSAWRRNTGQIALFGVVLMLTLIAWERLSAIIFALFYGGEVASVERLIGEVLLSGAYWPLLIAYFGIGALVALTVFAIGVVTAPLLLDRDVDVVTAIVTSVRCCQRNPGPMLLWAAIIAVLTAIGFATYAIGLIVVFPIIGHATWHAYRDLVA